jgi:hypothetical protein
LNREDVKVGIKQNLIPRRRLLLVAISLLIILGALVVVSSRAGFWSLNGVAVQVFDPNPTMFNDQGVLVCASSRAWGIRDGKVVLTHMHILPETRILDQRTSFIPTSARISDLRVGQRLRVWTRGGALFSYPLQVYAERLVIEDDGQPTALDCEWRGLEP